MKNDSYFKKSYKDLIKAYDRALSILKENIERNDKAFLTIHLMNLPEQKSIYRVVHIRILTKGEHTVYHYDNMLRFNATDEINEKVLKKFLILLLDECEAIYYVDSELTKNEECNPIDDIVNIYIDKSTIISLHKNCIEYLDIIAEASNKSISKNFKLLEFLKIHGYSVEGYVEKSNGYNDSMSYFKYLFNKSENLTSEETIFYNDFIAKIKQHKNLFY